MGLRVPFVTAGEAIWVSGAFRQRFEHGYRVEDGSLSDDWWSSARLLDATHLVEILGESRDLRDVFTECRDLAETIVANGC